jgi:hypothetical protein
MAPSRKRSGKRSPAKEDPLEPYRRIRKAMPPPEKVIPDQRRKAAEREAEREVREGRQGER